MTTRKRNEFLDIVDSEDEDNDAGYDSEAAEESKGRTTKRRKTQPRKDILESGSEEEASDGSENEEESDAEGGGVRLPNKKTARRDESEADENDDEQDYGDHDEEEEQGDQYLDATAEAETAKEGKKKKKSKPLDKFKDKPKKNKTGVVYLSSLPPYMKPFALKSLLEARGFGPITKVFLSPEVRAPSAPKRRSNKRKTYSDGWIEFASKKTAKICAESMNASIVGGRKGGWYHDDVLNIKYLKNFKWADLTEQIERERNEREAKRRIEDTRARKEEKVFLQGYEKGKMLEGIQKKNEEKRKRKMQAGAGGEEKDKPVNARRTFTQSEVRHGRDKISDDQESHRCNSNLLTIFQISRMMHRTILRAPRRCQEIARAVPFISSPSARYTFLSHARLRTLTSSSHLSTDHPPSSSISFDSPQAEEKEAKTPQPTPNPSQHVPWYLQDESAVPATAEVTSRDKLPELPENPPKILPELLGYIFKDLGLDELKLLDLRQLETPAALGANVIMIVGTARSVKHLNVSADRLCRWLRSNYKLSPYADGLLGRNELKIKLRRKARRARVASRTGTMFDDKDDGITTGWICVNAGVVEKETVSEQVDSAFEGFGPLVNGIRVVVQMFTEEKRAELDLETLWEGRITRAQREKEKYSDVAMDAPEEVRLHNSPCLSSSPSDSHSSYVARSPVIPPLEQRRQFHSRGGFQARSWHHFATRRLMSQTRALTAPAPGANAFSSPAAPLLQYITNLPEDRIKSSLGDNPEDPDSTDYLRIFHDALSRSPMDLAALAHLELMCFAHAKGFPLFSREAVHKAFMGCCISASEIPERINTQVLNILLAPRTSDEYEGDEWYTESDREIALSVLDQLILRGRNFMNLGMFTRLYNLAALPTGPGDPDDELTYAERGAHVLRMIDILDIPFEPLAARRLMLSLVRNGDYDSFWKWWRSLPLKGSGRDYEDYVMLFRMFVEQGDGRQARDCIATWVPMMQREDPPVPIEGELVELVMDCLRLAEPDVEHKVEEGRQNSYAKLWRECVSRLD
ncbi:uncharacterized protein BDV17DRAFT_301513 [Aspergillus undulatus]|uniref:uncharacterized protein n=1 Tax=Aspergillus undulatus TaxID=1810928 RepID=UPI003CCD8472